MKYEFKKNDIDSYSLIYTSKEKKEVKKDFKRTIEMAGFLQGITARARVKLGNSLSSMGMTKDNLMVKKDLGNGKVVYDETNYNNTLQGFIEEESLESCNSLIEKSFGMNIIDLFKDMGVNVEEGNIDQEIQNQISLFVQKFTSIIKGEEKEKIPSEKPTEN